MHKNSFVLKVRIVFIISALFLVFYVFYKNFSIFEVRKYFSTDSEERIVLNPNDRFLEEFEDNQVFYKQINDFIYFSLSTPYRFDIAKTKVILKNSLDQIDVQMGFQKDGIWSFDTKLIDTNILNDINWSFVGENPRLYQKNLTYSSYEEFLRNPPEGKVIASYDYDANILMYMPIIGYSPSNTDTEINVPLRGKVVFYVYLKDEPFSLNISKQDLNWQEDPDEVNILIYKEKDVVYQATIEDDGITDTSREVNPSQEAFIHNPGPDLPESGVYKVIVDAGSDSIITQIKTNLHKIIFDSPLLFVSNSEVYPKIISSTTQNTVFTDSLSVSALTNHKPALQEIKVGGNVLKLDQVNIEASASATPSASLNQLTQVTIPKSDILLKGDLGYFAFSPEQFFKPSKFRLFAITKKEDLEKVDYLITNYKPSKQEDEWRVAETDFDLRSAFMKNGKLSWIIKAPGLKERGGEVIIKDIEVELTKKPLINWKL